MNAVEELIKSSGGRLMMRGKNPCIIISEDLPDSEFINVMLDLSRKTFYETFTIHELWLMKKSNTAAEDQLVNIFRLQPTDWQLREIPKKCRYEITNSINTRI